MAQNPTTLIAQPVTLATSYALTVTDNGGAARTVTVPAGTYRMLLASVSAGTGTVAAPWETATKITALLNAASGASVWGLTMLATGYLHWTYTGPVSGTITFDAGGVIRKMLGMSGSIGLSSGASFDSNYQPPGCLFIATRASDTYWTSAGTMAAYGQLPTGETYGWESSITKQVRAFNLRLHPTNATAATALSSNVTPLYPDDESRIRVPSGPVGAAPPWSAHDFVRTAGTKRLGAALGTFAARVAGTGVFDEVYLTPAALTHDRAQSLSVAAWSQRMDWAEFELARYRETSSA